VFLGRMGNTKGGAQKRGGKEQISIYWGLKLNFLDREEGRRKGVEKLKRKKKTCGCQMHPNGETKKGHD